MVNDEFTDAYISFLQSNEESPSSTDCNYNMHKLSDYTILNLIGRGATGTVYKVKNN